MSYPRALEFPTSIQLGMWLRWGSLLVILVSDLPCTFRNQAGLVKTIVSAMVIQDASSNFSFSRIYSAAHCVNQKI